MVLTSPEAPGSLLLGFPWRPPYGGGTSQAIAKPLAIKSTAAFPSLLGGWGGAKRSTLWSCGWSPWQLAHLQRLSRAFPKNHLLKVNPGVSKGLEAPWAPRRAFAHAVPSPRIFLSLLSVCSPPAWTTRPRPSALWLPLCRLSLGSEGAPLPGLPKAVGLRFPRLLPVRGAWGRREVAAAHVPPQLGAAWL